MNDIVSYTFLGGGLWAVAYRLFRTTLGIDWAYGLVTAIVGAVIAGLYLGFVGYGEESPHYFISLMGAIVGAFIGLLLVVLIFWAYSPKMRFRD